MCTQCRDIVPVVSEDRDPDQPGLHSESKTSLGHKGKSLSQIKSRAKGKDRALASRLANKTKMEAKRQADFEGLSTLKLLGPPLIGKWFLTL